MVMAIIGGAVFTPLMGLAFQADKEHGIEHVCSFDLLSRCRYIRLLGIAAGYARKLPNIAGEVQSD